MSTKIRVAVTGASGLLGRPLMKSLTSDSRFEAHGAAFSRAAGGLDRVDLTSTAAIERWLDRVRPDVVVHLAAERRPDVYAADPASADRLNIGATETLAGICAAREVNLLFLSTDYVFDGTSPPYGEEDEPNPLNDYGRSKLAGERAVAAASARHRILRVPILHGPSDSLDESAVTVVARGFLEGDGPVLLDDRQIRYPTFTPDIARAIAGLLPGLAEEALPGTCPPLQPGRGVHQTGHGGNHRTHHRSGPRPGRGRYPTADRHRAAGECPSGLPAPEGAGSGAGLRRSGRPSGQVWSPSGRQEVWKQMSILDLTHYLEAGMPVYPGTEPPVLEEANTISRDGFREKKITLYSHTGTHMDAPAHILPGAPTLDEIAAGSVYRHRPSGGHTGRRGNPGWWVWRNCERQRVWNPAAGISPAGTAVPEMPLRPLSF